jgi:SAM-dependent methyltransferase
MGTAATQGPLWGTKAKDWSSIQEQIFAELYEGVFDALRIEPGTQLLDIGCGSGLATRIAAQRGATVNGFDASEGLLDLARNASSTVSYRAGDMEQLPYDNGTFDVVTGFNAFQYAESIPAALREARRVVKPGGRVTMAVWGPPENCEHAATLRAAGSCLPPPPPGAPGPFALSGNGIIEDLMRDAPLSPIESGSVNCAFAYPDADTAWRGISSAGPFIRAIQHAGEPAVKAAAFASLEPYKTPSGGYRQENVFRYVIAERGR